MGNDNVSRGIYKSALPRFPPITFPATLSATGPPHPRQNLILLLVMASTNLTEYERRRLENIKRNGELIASLKIHSALADLSSSSKPKRPKSFKLSPAKKQKTESPVVIRRSLRARGIKPDLEGLKDDEDETPTKSKNPKLRPTPRESIHHLGPLSTKEAYSGSGSDEKLIKTILGFSKNSQNEDVGFRNVKSEDFETILGFSKNSQNEDVGFRNVKSEDFETILGFSKNSLNGDVGFRNVKSEFSKNSENEDVGFRNVKSEDSGSIDLDGMKLEPENIARVVPGRIMALKFFPIRDRRMVVVGNKFGNVGFWNVDCGVEEGDADGIYVYHPHTGPVGGISIQPNSMSKIITCCYDGFIRLMDIERETFDLAYHTTNAIFSVSYRPNDVKSLYFGEGAGKLGIWDEKSGITSSWSLHDKRINTIDFCSANTNLMATSSTDGTACIWDLRNIDAKKPKALKVVRHSQAVHSAYFSPSGSLLATTSLDDRIGITSGANYDNMLMISHNNHTGRWLSSFRAIWGWDDSYVFVGSMKREIDVISATVKREIAALRSQNMSAIPCRFDAHPFNAGVLAGATSGGQVYIWNS